jgi:hypothetical protein
MASTSTAMTITVYGPDGSAFDFRDGTSNDVIVSALSKRYGRSMRLDSFRDEHGNILIYSVRE